MSSGGTFFLKILRKIFRKAMSKNFVRTASEDVQGRSQMFFKIGVLKKFAKFTGKHLCWSRFLIKLQASPDLNGRLPF